MALNWYCENVVNDSDNCMATQEAIANHRLEKEQIKIERDAILSIDSESE